MWLIYESQESRKVHIASSDYDKKTFMEALDNGTLVKFRLSDADSEVYYWGWMTEIDFAPLDDYGKAFGCTTLEYLDNGKWVEL